MTLQGKTILITGAAKRIGRALALGFAGQGADVLIHYCTSETEAHQLQSKLQTQGSSARCYQADLTQLAEIQKMTEKIRTETKGVDILIHNASYFCATPFGKTEESDWNQLMDIHIKAPYFLAQALAPTMKQTENGRMIFIADWTGQSPRKNYVPYGVSKGALLSLTKGLAKELAPEILVNAICPGPILPPPGMSEPEQEKVRMGTRVEHWGQPKDVVQTALFLAKQDFATGGHYVIDGGESL